MHCLLTQISSQDLYINTKDLIISWGQESSQMAIVVSQKNSSLVVMRRIKEMKPGTEQIFNKYSLNTSNPLRLAHRH